MEDKGLLTIQRDKIDIDKFWKSCLDRGSHESFVLERDWNDVHEFWSSCISDPSTIPDWLRGEEGKEYRFTQIDAIHNVAIETGEFNCSISKFSAKHTFALRIGYLGTRYNGYQRQKAGLEGIQTVEDDIVNCLKYTSVAAGRTDKDVSALSQVVTFSTHDAITPEDIAERFRAAEPCCSGRMCLFEVLRVPRRMHSNFMATWRRYTYLFPIKSIPHEAGESHDVDVGFVKAALQHLEGKMLHYNAFAYGEVNMTAYGEYDDLCILYHTNASIVQLSATPALCIELVGNRFLRRMVRIIASTTAREASFPAQQRDVERLVKITLVGARSACALPAPGAGLALTGVGYDLSKLDYRKRLDPPIVGVPKDPAVLSERKRRKERMKMRSIDAVIEAGDCPDDLSSLTNTVAKSSLKYQEYTEKARCLYRAYTGELIKSMKKFTLELEIKTEECDKKIADLRSSNLAQCGVEIAELEAQLRVEYLKLGKNSKLDYRAATDNAIQELTLMAAEMKSIGVSTKIVAQLIKTLEERNATF